MSKAEGKKIAIKFTMPLVGNVSGNESGFTVTGQEYQYTDGPDNNGKLVNKTYEVKIVEPHPTEENSIQLIMQDSIRNVQGLIIVNYNPALGNLAGRGGAVTGFTETFLPEDLEEGLTSSAGYGAHDCIEAVVTGSVELKFINKIPVYSGVEHIEAIVSGNIKLIDIDDINP